MACRILFVTAVAAFVTTSFASTEPTALPPNKAAGAQENPAVIRSHAGSAAGPLRQRFVPSSLSEVLSHAPVFHISRATQYWSLYTTASRLLLGGEAPANLSLIGTSRDVPAPDPEGLSQEELKVQWCVLETIVYVIIGLIFYNQAVVTGEKRDPVDTMNYDHFGCLEDSRTCWCAICCPEFRWADTVAMSGVAGKWQICCLSTFWCLFLVFQVSTLMDTLGFVVCTAALLTFFRQRIRANLEMPHCTASIVLCDCLFAFFCPWCFIAQEARVVNEMSMVGKLVGVDKSAEPTYDATA